jgi:hypothetical protein
MLAEIYDELFYQKNNRVYGWMDFQSLTNLITFLYKSIDYIFEI